MLARLTKAVRTVGRGHARAFGDWGNPNYDDRSGFKLPGSHGETDSLGANSGQKFGRDIKVPAYNPYEFTPYKMESQREKFLSGYSYEESFNIQKPSKTSKVVRTNMLMDNIVGTLIFVVILFMMMDRKGSQDEYRFAYNEYMAAQLSEDRNYSMTPAQGSASSETA